MATIDLSPSGPAGRLALLALAALAVACMITMATDEITLGASLQAEKGDLSIFRKISSLSVDMDGLALTHAIQNVGTNSETLTLTGDNVSPGWALIINLTTNTDRSAEIGVNAVPPLIRIEAHEFAFFRLATNAISARATTNTVNLEYWVLED